jgi:hypothetical protein
MNALAPDVAGFSRLMTALDPWLDRVVIVGGWAHRLYHLHPAAQKLDFAPLMTLDADVALPPTLPLQTPTIREALVAHGFEEEFRGDAVPPATLYHLGNSGSGFYAEFLTPLTGGEYTRSGRRKATVQIAGVNSQRLRFIELLLNDPWTVALGPDDFGLPVPKAVHVANPIGFLAQKLLIHRKRGAEDQAKDILYIHDTLQLFGARLELLRTEWTCRVRPHLHHRAAKEVETASDWLFGKKTDVIRKAAGIAAGRRLTPETVRESCRYGLQQMSLIDGTKPRRPVLPAS